jgi:hypothetical protein
MQFISDHPIGTILSTAKFDEWLAANGLLTLPPKDAPKDSDAWLGHLQRRHIQRNRLNKAATHPRMIDQGSTPFLVAASGGGFEVQAPHIAVSRAELPAKLKSIAKTKYKQLGHLMQSADWTRVPPHDRAFAEGFYLDIEHYVDRTSRDADFLNRKYDLIAIKLRQYTKLLNPPSSSPDDDEEEE